MLCMPSCICIDLSGSLESRDAVAKAERQLLTAWSALNLEERMSTAQLPYFPSAMWQLKFCDGRIPIPYVLPVTSPCLPEGRTNGAALTSSPWEKEEKLQLLESELQRWVNSKVCSRFLWTARNIFQCWDMMVKLVRLPLLGLAQVRSLFKAGHGRGKGINSTEA